MQADLITTTEGPIEYSRLVTKDIVSHEPGKRVTATEWYLEGKLVRRDVWVNMTSLSA
jgi:hypothetical protein